MNRSILSLLLMCLFALYAIGSEQEQLNEELESLSIGELESKLGNIDSQLENLSSFSLRGGTGAIGYRSTWGASTQWIEILLDKSYPLDEIILVPCLWRHPSKAFLPDAFPKKLRILAGSDHGRTQTEIASYSQSEDFPKGIEPLVIPLSGIEASWVRIEATELSERYFDSKKVFQLSEVLLFSGEENIALNRPIKFSSTDRRGVSRVWNERYAVDGFVPYLMDSSQGARSNAFIAVAEENPNITLDLEEVKPISRIHLHAVEQSDTVPQAYAAGLGIPDRMRIQGSLTADFSDAVDLLNFHKGNALQTGPIIIRKFPETLCRYIRLIPQVVESSPQASTRPAQVGFSEIEVLSRGENVALNKTATSHDLKFGQRSLSALTDGNNLYGEILTLREWMSELAKRGELERQRPSVLAELNLRYDRQEKLLNRMVQLVILLIVVIGFVIMVDRHFRMQKINQIRERIAADLHDELGANIHTIGLISDMAKNAMDSREELRSLLDEIRVYTEKSGDAARYCTNILEARGVCEDLVDEMTQFANRSLADIEQEFYVAGEEILKELPTHTRIDLLLFYKECLTNILRHSGASKVKTRLFADSKTISMIVSDNGIGLEDSNDQKVPKSLIRRAKLLKATIDTERSVTGGARVTLILKNKKFRLFK